MQVNMLTKSRPQRADGQNYAPKTVGVSRKVCGPGEFPFAAVHLDHGHINGMTNGLLEAGGELRYVFDPDPKKVAAFVEKYPQARAVDSLDRILGDPDIKMVASAAIFNERGPIGVRVMQGGKDYFCDKPLFTNAGQVAAARKAAAETGRKYMGYFSERLHVECAVKAGEFVQAGRIGRVVNVMGWGPHRLNRPSRPAWFLDSANTGGIIADIGSHQIEQFLFYTGASDAAIVSSRVANYRNKDLKGFQDFGDVVLTADNGATGYLRLDWLTPDALETWGDGRTLLVGTEGFMELRKYTDLGGSMEPDTLLLVNKTENLRYDLYGQVGYPFFGELILDCLHRTENAMTQERVFRVSELAIEAQRMAVTIE